MLWKILGLDLLTVLIILLEIISLVNTHEFSKEKQLFYRFNQLIIKILYKKL